MYVIPDGNRTMFGVLLFSLESLNPCPLNPLSIINYFAGDRDLINHAKNSKIIGNKYGG